MVDRSESFEKNVVDNSDANFVEKLEKQLQRILRNPVGRAIIRCIIDYETEDKIVFVPIANFFDKKHKQKLIQHYLWLMVINT